MNIDNILQQNLTSEQYKAVVDDSKNILCLACAGSGKSRTLAYKIAYLVAKGEEPESIIAFTFTEKAADSIKRRVAEALKRLGFSENIVGAMFIGTIDAFCQKLLGNIDAKYRQFDILDQNRLILYVMSRRSKLGIDNGKGYFKRINEFVDAWQTMNNENIKIDEIKQYDDKLYDRLKKLSKLMIEDGYMDFSFAVYLVVQELEKIKDEDGSYIEKFKYLFVDEYQDINPIQEEFIKILSAFLHTLFVVGDDDQSIYGWRGANVQNILTFEDRYQNVSVHKLLTNFRSTEDIVNVSNSFIKKEIPIQRLKKEITYNQNGNIHDLKSLWFLNRADEAKWVANRIKSLIGTTYIEYNSDGTERTKRGLTYSDFAVLIRGIHSKNGENRDVQFVNALRELNIPVKTSGEGGIFDREYAQSILKTMELLRDGEKIDREKVERCFNNYVLPVFPDANKMKYFQVLQDWYSKICMSTTSARRKVYPQNFLHELADAINLRKLKDETALRDLGLFSDIIKDIEQTYVSIDTIWRYREMLNFLQNIAKNYELDSIDYISKIDAVNVSTIHKAKGLEYPVVFVVDLVNQRFPGKKYQYKGILPTELMRNAIDRGAYGNSLEDEARLFYTAITRAERVLYLTGSEIHPGLKTKKKPSRFIEDLKDLNIKDDKNFTELDSKIDRSSRFDDNELPTNFSSVKSYLTCPFMYKLQNIYGYNAAVPELFGFGQTTHTILEKLHQKYKDRIPTEKEIYDIVESTFMLKHVFPSKDPENNPGSYERAKNLVHKIMKEYVQMYSEDFCRIRQDEASFELLVDETLITGSIDLLLKEDESKNISEAEVIDFKSMEVPDNIKEFDWREMALQVQLYSRAAKQVIGENVKTGYVHTLKNNKRVPVPVDESSICNAIDIIKWAVKGILAEDFPMRACKTNCKKCDYKALCRQEREQFKRKDKPSVIYTPTGEKYVAAFDEECEEF